MNSNSFALILLFALIGCGGTEENKKVDNVSQLAYDTIVIDHNVTNEKAKEYNLLFNELSITETIEALKSLSAIQGIVDVNEDGLPFDQIENRPKFYSNNIPRPIYKRIFPDEDIQIDKVRNTSAEVNEKEKTVTIQKGVKITETRKHKHLLSLIEKNNYLQLLFTVQGKYVPEIMLVTVSKKDLSQIDEFNLYGGIYDSYDINFWHSKLDNDYETFVHTTVKNTEFYDIELDTTIVSYKISADGKIQKGIKF